MSNEKVSVLQKIFSVKNEDIKIKLNILGFKLTFKNNKLIQEREEYYRKNLVLPYVECSITTLCSLKCKFCGNLNTHYYYMHDGKLLKDTPLEIILKSFDNLLQSVDVIESFRIMGGEPLLYKELPQVLEFLSKSPKIKEIVLVTNATMIPSPEVLEVLKRGNISCCLGHYGRKVSVRFDELCKLLDDNNIKHTESVDVWNYTGGTEYRYRNEEKLSEVFERCTTKACKHILNGKLYVCPRAAHGENLGLYNVPDREVVDLINTPIPNLREDLRNLYYNTQYTMACNYCDGVRINGDSPVITPGEQMRPSELRELRQKCSCSSDVMEKV